MKTRPRLRALGWMFGLFLPSLLLAGCAGAGLGGHQTRQPRAGDAAFSLGENGHTVGVREIKVGIGAGTLTKDVQVGRMPDGYLVTLTWTGNLQLVRLLCVHPQAAGCQRSERVPPQKNHPGYHRQFIVVYAKERMSDLTLKIMAHEICHAVANSQHLQPDPCHDENGGRI